MATGQGKKKPARPAWMRSKKLQRFLAFLKQEGNVSHALRQAGLTRSWVYEKRQTDANFAETFEEARRCGLEALIDEAHRRAYEGVDKGIYHQGELVYTERRYSDTLLMFLIKQADPSYRERFQVEAGEGGGTPFMFQMVLHPDVVKGHTGKK